ncbi:MAG: hypothetical protein NDI61_04750 [Bdellovibrionaceae bacterium]|nr:hypothetical protein [Pseudobdellovibrionaceae bacterium]
MKKLSVKLNNRYRMIDGKPTIDLKLKTPHQLFDERDPAPFRERDLDDDAVRYIVSSYKELPSEKGATLSLYIANMASFEGNPDEIRRAIHTYFIYEAELKRRELRDTFKHGLISLVIGLSFLAICTWFSMTVNAEGHLFRSILKEWLMLMGWVATWKPISIFLYEWWPIRGAMHILRDLGQIEIQVYAPESMKAPEPRPAPAAPKSMPLTPVSLKIS